MTTVTAPNVANIAIEGTFDDCQDLVKAMFADAPFRQEMQLSAMNSINWARIAAQVPYYVAAALAFGAPDREVAFSVPTGNFGNVLAAWVARRMGLPVARLIVGSNRNDILARFLAIERHVDRGGRAEPVAQHGHPGQFQLRAPAVRTAGARCGRDGGERWRRSAALAGWPCRTRPGIAAARCSMASGWTMRAPRRRSPGCTRRCGYLADPHTAIGIAAAEANPPAHGVMTVAMATAHPAKFPDAIERVTGVRPAPAAAACRSVRSAGALHRAAERPCRGRGAGARARAAQRMKILDAAQTAAALPFDRLIPALREAFVVGCRGAAAPSPRHRAARRHDSVAAADAGLACERSARREGRIGVSRQRRARTAGGVGQLSAVRRRNRRSILR